MFYLSYKIIMYVYYIHKMFSSNDLHFFMLLLQTIGIIVIEYCKYIIGLVYYKITKEKYLYLECEKKLREETVLQMTHKIGKVNILYIKMLQWITHDSIHANENIQRIFRNITDQVEYDNEEIDLTHLEESLGTVLRIDKTPLSKGTMAIVFQGEIISGPHEGQKVVVKCLRNNVQKDLENAVSFFLFLSQSFQWIPSIKDFHFDKIILESKEALLSQTDFIQEVRNLENFQNAFKEQTNMLVPTVLKEYSNEKWIVMTFIEGVNAFTLHPMIEKDRKQCINILNRFIFSSLFEHGIFHGDMHPGNVLFQKVLKEKEATIEKEATTEPEYDYKIGFVDFGIVYTMKPESQKHIFHFLKHLVNKKWENFYLFLIENGIEYTDNISDVERESKKKALLLDLLESREKYNLFSNEMKLSDYIETNKVLKQYNALLCIEFTRFFMFLISMFSLIHMIITQNSKTFDIHFLKFSLEMKRKGHPLFT